MECRVEHRVRRPPCDISARLPEVVFDGDDALVEENVDPGGRGGEAIAGRRIGIGGNRLLEGDQRLRVVEGLAEVEAAGAKRRGGGRRRDRLARRRALRRGRQRERKYSRPSRARGHQHIPHRHGARLQPSPDNAQSPRRLAQRRNSDYDDFRI